MGIRILKVISLFFVMSIFFILLSRRHLTLSTSKTLVTKSPLPTSLQKNDPQSEVAPEQKVMPIPVETLKKEIKMAPVAKIVTPATASPYTRMNTGTSDTDESYAPTVSPCKVTMGYKIGSFDTRFGISKTEFIQDVTDASSLWDKAEGKTLFTYDPNGKLTINLIYDARQANTEAINNLSLEIDNSKATAEGFRASYTSDEALYTSQGDALTRDNDALQLRYKAYTDKVVMYNSRGGASQSEYTAMTAELDQIKNDAKDLETRRTALLAFMDSINKKVAAYNNLVVYINSLIKESNSLGATKFTEGRFTPSTNTIDIYQYSNTTKLLRVVTHELGHTIGINHNNDPLSIMYAINTATTTILSTEDIQSLKAICGQ